ncbi:MAG: 50S ribosomal protein L25/general stress protein Ctc [Gammaproteobacteria bacterium]|jgi:large subunit ribosomal protein L25|nr:50S ribosomal protein L25/general stress protein Ctc [Gammaproteobacteria bacterium]
MSDSTTIIAEFREDVGKGASRRLRREGKVPAVIYGGHREPAALTVQQQELLHAAENEAFYASILEIQVGKDKKQQAVVRDMQRHPFKPLILHIDFMRVSAEEVLRISVPIHFIGEEESPAGKASGVVIQHQMTEVEIAALPKDLPEYVSCDLSEMDAGDVVMLSDIQLPEGVTIPTLEVEGEDNDVQVANAVHIKADQGTGAAAAAEAEAALADELGELPVEEEGAEEEADEEESGESEEKPE